MTCGSFNHIWNWLASSVGIVWVDINISLLLSIKIHPSQLRWLRTTIPPWLTIQPYIFRCTSCVANRHDMPRWRFVNRCYSNWSVCSLENWWLWDQIWVCDSSWQEDLGRRCVDSPRVGGYVIDDGWMIGNNWLYFLLFFRILVNECLKGKNDVLGHEVVVSSL